LSGQALDGYIISEIMQSKSSLNVEITRVLVIYFA
jgi:hypothetical protein